MGKIIELLNGALIDINDGCFYQPGCPTCDYGSIYTRQIDFILTSCELHIEVNEMYEYPELSIGDIIRLLTNLNYENMMEQDFCETVKNSFSIWAEEKNYGLNFQIIDKRG